jgi:hypothetical protein
MKLDNELREFLSNHYSTDAYYVDPQTDIETVGESVFVTGIMPQTNQVGQFFAGDLGDIQWEMERETQWQMERETAAYDPDEAEAENAHLDSRHWDRD